MDKNDLKKYLDRTDLVIENNLCKWSININGDINGLYTGNFTFRCFLTPTQKIAASRDFRELLGPNPIEVDEHTDNLCFTVSQLKYRVLSGPPFWSSSLGINGYLGDIPDEPVLDAILDAALSAEWKYTALLQDRKDKALERAKKASEAILEENKNHVVENPDK